MQLYSYVVARDYGFAPNPFGAACTLATCKPLIRRGAKIGDWIVGLASKDDAADARIVYVMRVDEAMTFQEYWTDPRFEMKKPNRRGSLKQVFGDNIYHKDRHQNWCQLDSHHSCDDGSINHRNVTNDTQTDRVLVGFRYAYWGSKAIPVPARFRGGNGRTLEIARGHRNQFPEDFKSAFVRWFEGLDAQGYIGVPFRWTRPNASWARFHPGE